MLERLLVEGLWISTLVENLLSRILLTIQVGPKIGLIVCALKDLRK